MNDRKLIRIKVCTMLGSNVNQIITIPQMNRKKRESHPHNQRGQLSPSWIEVGSPSSSKNLSLKRLGTVVKDILKVTLIFNVTLRLSCPRGSIACNYLNNTCLTVNSVKASSSNSYPRESLSKNLAN
ncbi:PREDICTED: uncharacterized protein LOC101302915 [Fragaria vesca subsp. vesca]